MGVVLNELSLDGQFQNIDDFSENLKEIIEIIKNLKNLGIAVFIHSDIYSNQRLITKNVSFLDFFNSSRLYLGTRFKQLLLNSQYWDASPLYDENDEYISDIPNFSCPNAITEACERRKEIISFKHDKYFNSEIVSIIKNKTKIEIINFLTHTQMLDYYYSLGMYSNNELEYCKLRFKNKLDFSDFNESAGFIVVPKEHRHLFMDDLSKFDNMDWNEILSSNFDYKQALDDHYNQLRITYPNLTKFRVTRRYRCYGFRDENNRFHVIGFNISHSRQG